MMQPRNTEWTMAQIKRMLTLRASGLTIAQVAQQIGRSRASVNGQLQRLRAVQPDLPKYPLVVNEHTHAIVCDVFLRARAQGLTAQTLARAAGLGLGQVRAMAFTVPDLIAAQKLAGAVGATLTLQERPHASD